MAAATVPCKYKTGKVLGNGTYATVKGNSTKKKERFKSCSSSEIRGDACKEIHLSYNKSETEKFLF